MDTSKLNKPDLTESPEVLDTVNMIGSVGRLVFAMLDPIMFLVTVINTAVAGIVTVEINDGFREHAVLRNSFVGASSSRLRQL